ncbi:unnamed protein product [Rotaria magnacalcarata]|uniref:Phorbol-ester/DAG-type domain-containing protein n=1 Tax=Rotaria magnacalcarata TaxID=392030 RepID=A0A816YK14_9BILA|nr:unnamed protein product [Rotaria magnacalcarata]
MFLLVIIASYFFGCLSTIALVICLFLRFGLYAPGTVFEEEQFQTCQQLAENDRAQNATVDTVNYLLHFLFQEIKDGKRLRRFIMHKLHVEFDELKETRLGKLFLQDIVILSFSPGKECPIFSDIQFGRQERDERQLIKEFVAKLNGVYRDGFSCTLDIKLAFGLQCQLYIKVNRIRGNLRLEFRREPFSHWIAVFQNEPLIDLEVRSYLFNREAPLLSTLITQRILRAIRRKHIWPNYKIRYQPFFPKSKQSLPIEIPSINNQNFISGIMEISIRYCDRLSIPFELFNKENASLLSIFLSFNIDNQMCKDYLRINRDQWIKKEIEFIPQMHRITIKEVLYMGRIEFLIETFNPVPDGIDDVTVFKESLENQNIFLFQMEGQEMKTLRNINRLLKYQLKNGHGRKVKIVVGIPLLHCVQVQREVEIENTHLTDKTDPELSTMIQQRTAVNVNQSGNFIQRQNSNEIKTSKEQKNSSSDALTLIMLNTDDIQKLLRVRTPTKKAEPFVEFNHKFQFEINPNDQYLNFYLWYKPPLDLDIPQVSKKLILLGYTTVAVSELVIDAHMSFKRETSMTLNFQSAYTSKPNLKSIQTNSKSKKLAELSTHRGYDDNMAHGFVTIDMKHEPTTEKKLDSNEKTQSVLVKNDKKNRDQPISSSEEHKSSLASSYSHLFEDHTFSVKTLCANCNSKIWIPSGRLCRYCFIAVHKKCEKKWIIEHVCTRKPIRSVSKISLDDYSIISTDDIALDSNKSLATSQLQTTVESAASAAFTLIDLSASRSLYSVINKNFNVIPSLVLSDNELISNPSTNSSSSTEQRSVANLPVHVSSKFINAALLTYGKLVSLKGKQMPSPFTLESKRKRSSSDSAARDNISEDDLQDFVKKCLSNETIDAKSFETLIHEKAVDHTALYTQANELGAELFPDLPVDERRQKFENEISRLQQEIDLQDRIRDELIIEYNSELTDEHTKRNIQTKITNVREKVQALAALTILYCSGLKHCYSQT